ncbi:hypothetical protein PENSPDRAFT_264957 [Peniophora sp. CONT]|nr:hypothetical protein PENSPDRAFT_264957 [Peniophora sp. CONT]
MEQTWIDLSNQAQPSAPPMRVPGRPPTGSMNASPHADQVDFVRACTRCVGRRREQGDFVELSPS